MDITTVDLPDHISFEEIALKWCEVLDGLNVLPTTGMMWLQYNGQFVR